ncbi:MAG: T9SS type A sorting domain-containing protein [FCB group bacterium]|nr:T9SS type A sorting domain-containing protein [FCB group bacterium]
MFTKILEPPEKIRATCVQHAPNRRYPPDSYRGGFFRIGMLWFLWTALSGYSFLGAQTASNNLLVVIIDGARYSETFGDPNRTYIPNMNSIARNGSLVNTFYNDSLTYTSRAIPALWCGSWTTVQDTIINGQSTQYTRKPTLFEYFRKQASISADSCVYILKYVPSLWLPSFHPDYGPDFWPSFVSEGSEDQDVLQNTLDVMNATHPRLLWVYFAGVDHAGHSGDWAAYTQAIQVADSCVGVLWDALQQDSVYAGRTNLMVTNDHGRHDDQHGGFSGHGDDCDGCRHIMLLAAGPDIRSNLVTGTYRRTPDFAVTASQILGITPEYATGNPIQEILTQSTTGPDPTQPVAFHLGQNYPNPFNGMTRIPVSAGNQGPVSLVIYNLRGERVKTLVENTLSTGRQTFVWDGRDDHHLTVSSGLYFYVFTQGNHRSVRKLVLLQ